ncbi:hypothetical protein JXA40_00840 [bacterium]|nr:hypothetical protein [candidate division CSSED10-310 bacterium]
MRGKVFQFILIAAAVAVLIPARGAERKSPTLRIVFDDLHGQSFGNADWVIDGAYSELADDLRQFLSAKVSPASRCFESGYLTGAALGSVDLLILPEANTRYGPAEISSIRNFVMQGGGIFLIADHGGSDRNSDGWDSALILNELTMDWGITFAADTWSEAPVGGVMDRNHPITDNLGPVGAWSATSIYIEPGTGSFKSLLTNKSRQTVYMAAGTLGEGRIFAIGDSSPFDDGSGGEGKNLHPSYRSWLYDHSRLAVQASAWLMNIIPSAAPATHLPYPLFRADAPDVAPRINQMPRIILDTAHGNTDTDQTGCFCRDVTRTLGWPILINQQPFTSLWKTDVLLLINPSLRLTDQEVVFLNRYLHDDGGSVLIATGNLRSRVHTHENINRILQDVGSSIRIRPDEITDNISNNGKPWSLSVQCRKGLPWFRGIDGAIFWRASTLINAEGKILKPDRRTTVLATASRHARSIPFPGHATRLSRNGIFGKRLPVAAIEKIGKGRMAVLSANPLTDYQYETPEADGIRVSANRESQTARFNLAVVRMLHKL